MMGRGGFVYDWKELVSFISIAFSFKVCECAAEDSGCENACVCTARG